MAADRQHRFGGFGGVVALGGAAVFGLGRGEDDQPGEIVIAHLGGRWGAGDDRAVVIPAVVLVEAADDFDVQFVVIQSGGAVVGDLVEVFLGIEIIAVIVAPVEMIQLSVHNLDRFGIGGGAVARGGHGEVDLAGGEAANRFLGGAAEERGAGHAAGGAAHGAEPFRFLAVDAVGAGVIAVHLAHHRDPLRPQQPQELLADRPFAEGHIARHDQGGLVVVGAKPADGLRHHPQHAAGALELVI